MQRTPFVKNCWCRFAHVHYELQYIIIYENNTKTALAQKEMLHY